MCDNDVDKTEYGNISDRSSFIIGKLVKWSARFFVLHFQGGEIGDSTIAPQ